MTAIALLALAHLQSGHEIRFSVHKEEPISYRVWGTVFRQYAGGKTAPPLRSANVNAVFTISYKRTVDGFDAYGSWDALKLSNKEGALPENIRKRATFGKWIGAFPEGPYKFFINGQPASPELFSALGWPYVWAALKPGLSLRIDDAAIREMKFPVRPFLEDDPVDDITMPIRLVFQGPDHLGEMPTYRFRFDTDFSNTSPANHPENKKLQLTSNIRLAGSLVIRREDGRLESANVFASIKFSLAEPGDEIPFSSASASLSANWVRIEAGGLP